eukprot:2119323-Pleurochrysis_carterae.AAC.1
MTSGEASPSRSKQLDASWCTGRLDVCAFGGSSLESDARHSSIRPALRQSEENLTQVSSCSSGRSAIVRSSIICCHVRKSRDEEKSRSRQ